MGGSDEDRPTRGRGEAANGDAMVLDDGGEEVRVKAGEEDVVSAVAGRVMVIGRVGVELFQQLRGGMLHSARMRMSASSWRARL